MANRGETALQGSAWWIGQRAAFAGELGIFNESQTWRILDQIVDLLLLAI